MELWKKYRDSLILNDEIFLADRLNSAKITSQPNWSKSYWEFIKDWISDDNYLNVHTSGSTGTAKALLIHKNVFIASALNTGKYLSLKKGDKALLCLPGNYIAGKMMIVRAFVLRLNLHLQKPSSLPIINTKYNFVAMTPMQVQKLIESNKKSIDFIDKLIIGGAPVNDFISENLADVKSQAFETYGMTETVSHIALKSLNGVDKSEFFTLLSGIKIDTDQRNCLIVSSKNLMLKNLVSNDIVQLKNNKQFKWLGRYDNVINSGGVKLIPEQIESKLKSLLKSEFLIFGIKDKLLSTVPAIAIEGSARTDGIDFSKVLNKYEIPKIIYYLKSFIRTKSGKIKRKETINQLLKDCH